MAFDFHTIYQVMWTKGDAEILLEYIDTLFDSLYGLDNRSFESMAGKMPEETIARTLVAEIRKVPENQGRDYLRELKDSVKNCETIKLTTAVNLPKDMIGEIIEELRKKYNQLIIDLETDPEIVGGAKISWRGRYWEKTLYDQI